MKHLTEKVAVVTGAGSGIGKATAIQLAKEGCLLAISDIDASSLEETRQQIAGLNTKVIATTLNTANKQDVFDYADEVFNEFGQVNIVINNAGVYLSASIEHTSVENFEWLMNINFWGMVYGTQAFLPYLKKTGDGHIANVSSVFGFVAPASAGAYNSSKFAIRGYTETLRMELDIKNCGVSCSTIQPGGITTNLISKARLNESTQTISGKSKEDLQKTFNKMARTTPEKAAIAIIKGIKKNKMRILIGADAVIMDWLIRLFPFTFRRVMAWVIRRESRKKNDRKKQLFTTETNNTLLK